MPTLVKNLGVARDDWTLLEAPEANAHVPARAILPLAAWLEGSAALKARTDIGVWLAGDADPEANAAALAALPLLAIHIPAFADGRGLSLGALLRTRYGFGGELRAFGDILPDLAPYLHRCGFDAFVLADDRAAHAAIEAVGAITGHYQASATVPLPAFRRLARDAAEGVG